jgi:ribose 5-phosphate isomerase B
MLVFVKYKTGNKDSKNMNKKKIAIASDHAGFDYKEQIKIFLIEKYGLQAEDFGAYSTDSIDYPEVAHKLAQYLENNDALGIILCGSGNGVCMTVNKHKTIRGALCWDVEIARLARQHNDANVLCLPARFVNYNLVEQMVAIFLETPFEGGRHQKRVDKI